MPERRRWILAERTITFLTYKCRQPVRAGMVAQTTIITVDGDDYLIIEDPETGATIEGQATDVNR